MLHRAMRYRVSRCRFSAFGIEVAQSSALSSPAGHMLPNAQAQARRASESRLGNLGGSADCQSRMSLSDRIRPAQVKNPNHFNATCHGSRTDVVTPTFPGRPRVMGTGKSALVQIFNRTAVLQWVRHQIRPETATDPSLRQETQKILSLDDQVFCA